MKIFTTAIFLLGFLTTIAQNKNEKLYKAASKNRDKVKIEQSNEESDEPKYDSGTHELHQLVGLPIMSKNVQGYFNKLKDQPDIRKEKKYDYSVYKFMSKGIELFVSSEIVYSIDLYSEGYDGYRQYRGSLPFEIEFIDVRKTIEQKLGPPDKNDNGDTYRGVSSSWYLRGIKVTYKSTDPEDMNNSIQCIEIKSQMNEQEAVERREKDKIENQAKAIKTAGENYSAEIQELRELQDLHINSKKIQDYFKKLKDQPDIDTHDDDTFYEFQSKGVGFYFMNNILRSILLYAGYGEYSQYKGTLPFSIEFADVRKTVEQKLGPPDKPRKSDGPLDSWWLSKKLIIKYNSTGSKKTRTIESITLL